MCHTEACCCFSEQALGVLLSIPGKAIGAAISLLQKHLSESDHRHLAQFHKLVVAQLLSDAKDEDMHRELQSLRPALKQMAGIRESHTAGH